MNISISSSTEISAYIDLLEEASEWLWNKGVRQWKPGIHRSSHETITHLVENGYLILAHQDNKLAGGCILSQIGPAFWPSDPAALYLYKLVVARFAAGQYAGRAIVHFCTQQAEKLGFTSIRLDCWDGNDFLKSFYLKAGFRMLDAVPEKDYWVRPFEIKR